MNVLKFLALGSVILSGAVLAADKVSHVNAAEAAKLIQSGKVLVLDVRTPGEFSDGHIQGAINVDFNAGDFARKLAEVDKAKPVLVHCQSGGRSTRALSALEKAGFPTVYHLDGGFGDWRDGGHPVVK